MTQAIKKIIEEAKLYKLPDLNLARQNLIEVPKEIFELTYITSLNLMDNQLKDIPIDIVKLVNLETIWFMGNKIEYVPRELSELKKLKSVHLSRNLIKQLPMELLKHKRITHLCLRENDIIDIPIEITNSKIRDIQLDYNSITDLPIDYDNADIFQSIDFKGNPLENPPSDLFFGPLPKLLRFLIEKDRGKTFQVPFQNELKTTFKQYLIYFKEYLTRTKGILIGFEVRDIDEGLELEIKTANNSDEEIEQIKKYMQDYLNFVKHKVEDIKPQFEVVVDSDNQNFIIAELKSQVRHFQSQLDFKIAQNESLKQDRDRYYNLISKMVEQPITQVVQNSNSTNNVQLQKNHNEYKSDSNLQELLNVITILRKEIPSSESFVQKELELIDDKLLNAEDCSQSNDKVDKVPFKKLKRILDEINNEKSTLNQVVKGSEKAIKAAQKAVKLYNSFAEWLMLPQVPKILIGDETA